MNHSLCAAGFHNRDEAEAWISNGVASQIASAPPSTTVAATSAPVELASTGRPVKLEGAFTAPHPAAVPDTALPPSPKQSPGPSADLRSRIEANKASALLRNEIRLARDWVCAAELALEIAGAEMQASSRYLQQLLQKQQEEGQQPHNFQAQPVQEHETPRRFACPRAVLDHSIDITGIPTSPSHPPLSAMLRQQQLLLNVEQARCSLTHVSEVMSLPLCCTYLHLATYTRHTIFTALQHQQQLIELAPEQRDFIAKVMQIPYPAAHPNLNETLMLMLAATCFLQD